MTIIVNDAGFSSDASSESVEFVDLRSDTDPSTLPTHLDAAQIRVDFPSFADGRGFTLARQLRLLGFTGRLRASGHVLADQYAMARRAGFDEVEIDDILGARQPEADWLARANWQEHNYQSRLRG